MVWDEYPVDYRKDEIMMLVAALRAGDCAAVVGLSGSGKSNLLGFLAHRALQPGDAAYSGGPQAVLVDCNRLPQPGAEALFEQIRLKIDSLRLKNQPEKRKKVELTASISKGDAFSNLAIEVEYKMPPEGLVLILDRFDALLAHPTPALFSNLRALRDDFKYRLTLVIASRRPLPTDNELAELFFAHTLWLGPLSPANARWSAAHYAHRQGLVWTEAEYDSILRFSGRYAALLRAVCEAHATGIPLDLEALVSSPPVQARLGELWSDGPGEEEMSRCGLTGVPMGIPKRPAEPEKIWAETIEIRLTSKEQLLLDTLRAHPGRVCEKDDLIRAVWPEDRIFTEGVRDDSLAQLVRRLREKVETDPSKPERIRTAPGRGYIYHP